MTYEVPTLMLWGPIDNPSLETVFNIGSHGFFAIQLGHERTIDSRVASRYAVCAF